MKTIFDIMDSMGMDLVRQNNYISEEALADDILNAYLEKYEDEPKNITMNRMNILNNYAKAIAAELLF